MKFLVAFAIFVTVAVAAPQNPADAQATIVKQDSRISASGDFQNELQTSNGISSASQGVLKPNADPKEPAFIAVSGEYEYPNPDGGAPIKVKYTADEFGFRPEGLHLPVAPVA